MLVSMSGLARSEPAREGQHPFGDSPTSPQRTGRWYGVSTVLYPVEDPAERVTL